VASSENIQIVATAKDNASGQLKSLKGNVEALGSKAGGPLGGLIGGIAAIPGPALLAGAAIAGVTAFLADGVKSALEEEKSLARLDAALKANVSGWDGNRDAIDRAIESRMDLGFQDDQLRESMIKLVTATQNETDALKLQTLAMDVARAKDIDLATATDIVIKANAGNTKALKAMGIELEKGATRTEVLAEMQERFGGQAAAYAETTSGAMESANIAIGELAEDMGAMLLPIIGDVARAVKNDLIPAIQDMSQFVRDLITTISVADQLTEGSHLMGEIDFDDWKDRQKERAIEAIADIQRGLEDARMVAPLINQRETQRAAAEALKDSILGAVREAQATYESSARGLGNSIVQGIRSSKDDLRSTMDDLMWAIKHPLALTKRVAGIEAALTSKNLQKGLNSNNPLIRTQAEQTQARLRELWTSLTGIAWDAGSTASTKLETSLSSDYPEIKREATALVNAVNRIYRGINPPGQGGTSIADVLDNDRQRRRRRRNRHMGGSVQQGGTYLVGERGPELLTMGSQSGRVTPNHRMGGDTQIVMDGRVVARLIDERFGRMMALNSSTSYVRG
jgi:hypothetical protein